MIDFIDMDRNANNRAVEKRLKDKLATDRARLQIGRISSFGLLEMSRQRLRPGMLEASTKPCPHCHGEGLVRSDESLALTILRDIEEEGVRQRSAVVVVKAPSTSPTSCSITSATAVVSIEDRYNLRVVIEGDMHLISPVYKLEKMKEDEAPESLRRQKPAVTHDVAFTEEEDDDPIEDVAYEEDDAEEKTEQKPREEGRSGRRGSRGGKRRRKEESDPLPVIDLQDSEDEGEKPFNYGDKDEAKTDDRGGRKRSRRGGRGRSQRGKLGDREMAEAAATSMLSGRDALDDALPEIFKDADPAPQPELTPEPKAADAPAPEKSSEMETVCEIVEAPAEADHDAVVQVVETVTPEPEPEPAPEPDPTPVATFERPEPTPEKPGPKKRGWWSRNKSAS